jgi:dihydroorotase
VLGIPGGTLKPGSVADVTLFHPDQEITIRAVDFKSKSRNTPFEGWTLRGRPVATLLGGQKIALA